MAVSDWSATAAANTSVNGVNIAEGCPAGNLNNAVREVMAGVRTSISDFALTFLDETSAASVHSVIGAASPSDITSAVASAIPSGSVFYFAASTPPTGYLACNGGAISRTTFAALFAVVGTTYGAGDGSTTFNLPELRGEFIRGLDAGRGVDGLRAIGSAQAGSVEAHAHSVLYGTGNQRWSGGGSDFFGNTGSTTGSYGGSETRPRNVALLPCIKV